MDKIKNVHRLRKHRIQKRLSEFREFYTSPVVWNYKDGLRLVKSQLDDNSRIFEEMVFCILTANTSAVMGLKTLDYVREDLHDCTLEELQHSLKEAGYRFPNKRAEYIIFARKKFSTSIKEIIESYDNLFELRDYLVKNVKGFGYKEASHFLRNVGFLGLAILDKHVLNMMIEHGRIDERPKSMTQKRYLEIEQELHSFSSDLCIDFDELDLLLWSMKSGHILK